MLRPPVDTTARPNSIASAILGPVGIGIYALATLNNCQDSGMPFRE